MTHFRLHASDDMSTFEDFARHLTSYTDRSLMKQSDIPNAFTGILTSLYAGDNGIRGLPEADFDHAMLWHCDTEYKNGSALQKTIFPSWSWASTSQRVIVPIDNFDGAFVGTLVSWVYKDKNKEPRLVKSKTTNHISLRYEFGFSKSYIPQVCLLLAWLKGYIKAAPPEGLQQELENLSPDNDLIERDSWPDAQIPYKITVASTNDNPISGFQDRWPCLETVWKQIRDSNRDVPQAYTDDQLEAHVLLTRA